MLSVIRDLQISHANYTIVTKLCLLLTILHSIVLKIAAETGRKGSLHTATDIAASQKPA
jgi:hypothetical protein